jgi:hypothetical protein
MAVPSGYPRWRFFPAYAEVPEWVGLVVKAFEDARTDLDSRSHQGISSNAALARVRPGLERAGFRVEAGTKRADRIHRPVLFGEAGRPVVSYEVDAFHPDHGVVVEIEAGRGAANNADYRDLVRASLMVDASYLALAMMLEYRAGQAPPMRSYETTLHRLEAIYASERLKLPLKGTLLVGY